MAPQRPHGFAGVLDRVLNPTNALGQFGQALVAGGGSLADAMGYLMQSRAAQAQADGKFGDWKQQYDYELAHPKASQAGPHYWESNDGSLHAIGPDGKPLEVYHDPTPKMNFIPDGQGGGQWVAVPTAAPSMPQTTGITFTPIGGPPQSATGPFPVSATHLDRITAQGESGGRRYAANGSLLTSPAGAMGEMQVMPSTARAPGFGIRPWDGSSPDDLARVGREYRAKMQVRYGGDTAKMWAAYNWGPGNLDAAIQRHGPNWLDHAPAETQAYVTRNRRNLMGGN
jgi:soluble lytic murein transglycosylase